LGTEARERGIFDKSRDTMPYESPRYLTWPPYVFLVTKEERNINKGKKKVILRFKMRSSQE
jgi:hypothetical protein